MNDEQGYTMICSRCVNEMKSTARYCMKCGNLNMDHPDNKNMKKFYKNRVETYSVSNEQSEFVQDRGEVKQNLGNYRGINIVLTLGTLIFVIIVGFLSIKYIQYSHSMLDFIISPVVYISYVTISLSFISLFSSLLLFTKMGQSWWKALIPIYNLAVLSKCVFGTSYLWLLSFVPFVNFIYYILLLYNLGKCFDKNGILMVLFGFILVLVTAYDSSLFNNTIFSNDKMSLETFYSRKKLFLICTLSVFLFGMVLLIYNNYNFIGK